MTVFVKLLENSLVIYLAALADYIVILYMQHAESVGIFLQVSYGIHSTNRDPVNIHLEEYLVGICILNKKILESKIGCWHCCELHTVIMVSEFNSSFISLGAYLVQ